MNLIAVTDRFCHTLFYVGAIRDRENEASMEYYSVVYE